MVRARTREEEVAIQSVCLAIRASAFFEVVNERFVLVLRSLSHSTFEPGRRRFAPRRNIWKRYPGISND